MPVPAGDDDTYPGSIDLLATRADLAAMLQVDEDTIPQATADIVLSAATAVVQAAARQRLVAVAADTATLVGGSSMYLRLPERPVTAVTTVTLDGDDLTAGTGHENYRLSAGRLYRRCGWLTTGTDCYAPSEISVVYSHGYETGDPRLQLAQGYTLAIARAVYANPDGTVREQIDDYVVAYEAAASALTPAMAARLRSVYGRRAGMVAVV